MIFARRGSQVYRIEKPLSVRTLDWNHSPPPSTLMLLLLPTWALILVCMPPNPQSGHSYLHLWKVHGACAFVYYRNGLEFSLWLLIFLLSIVFGLPMPLYIDLAHFFWWLQSISQFSHQVGLTWFSSEGTLQFCQSNKNAVNTVGVSFCMALSEKFSRLYDQLWVCWTLGYSHPWLHWVWPDCSQMPASFMLSPAVCENSSFTTFLPRHHAIFLFVVGQMEIMGYFISISVSPIIDNFEDIFIYILVIFFPFLWIIY